MPQFMAQQRTQIWKHHNEALISLARTIYLPLYPPPSPCVPHTPCLAHDQRQFLNISTSPTWTTTFPVARSARVGTYTHTHTQTRAHTHALSGAQVLAMRATRQKANLSCLESPPETYERCILKQASPECVPRGFCEGGTGRRPPGARSVWSIGAGPEL